MKKHLYSIAATVGSFALFVALLASGAKSLCLFHQPTVPAGLEKFRK